MYEYDIIFISGLVRMLLVFSRYETQCRFVSSEMR